MTSNSSGSPSPVCLTLITAAFTVIGSIRLSLILTHGPTVQESCRAPCGRLQKISQVRLAWGKAVARPATFSHVFLRYSTISPPCFDFPYSFRQLVVFKRVLRGGNGISSDFHV